MVVTPIPWTYIEPTLYLFRIVPVFSMSFGIHRLYLLSSIVSLCSDIKSNPVSNFENSCASNEFKLSKEDVLYGCCDNKCKATDDCYADQNLLDFDKYGIGKEITYTHLHWTRVYGSTHSLRK